VTATASSEATVPGDVLPATEAISRPDGAGMGVVGSVYDECHASLFGYVASLTRDDAVAEEFVQEAFVRLVQRARERAMPDDPRAWLFAVCTNLAISRSRRRSIVGRWLHMVTPMKHERTGEAAEDTVLRRERDDQLARALERLPKDHRAALLLAAEGFSGREIAAILGKSEGATRNVLWRARLQLRDQLEQGDTT
jgi:RNA polymerase sigma-70 factor (ECF subfamily)